LFVHIGNAEGAISQTSYESSLKKRQSHAETEHVERVVVLREHSMCLFGRWASNKCCCRPIQWRGLACISYCCFSVEYTDFNFLWPFI